MAQVQIIGNFKLCTMDPNLTHWQVFKARATGSYCMTLWLLLWLCALSQEVTWTALHRWVTFPGWLKWTEEQCQDYMELAIFTVWNKYVVEGAWVLDPLSPYGTMRTWRHLRPNLEILDERFNTWWHRYCEDLQWTAALLWSFVWTPKGRV